jgi:hypothetical protein
MVDGDGRWIIGESVRSSGEPPFRRRRESKKISPPDSEASPEFGRLEISLLLQTFPSPEQGNPEDSVPRRTSPWSEHPRSPGIFKNSLPQGASLFFHQAIGYNEGKSSHEDTAIIRK